MQRINNKCYIASHHITRKASMKRKSNSRSKIPTISLWNIDEEKTFDAVLFDAVAPLDMPQYKAHRKSHFVVGYCIKGSFKSYIDFP